MYAICIVVLLPFILHYHRIRIEQVRDGLSNMKCIRMVLFDLPFGCLDLLLFCIILALFFRILILLFRIFTRNKEVKKSLIRSVFSLSLYYHQQKVIVDQFYVIVLVKPDWFKIDKKSKNIKIFFNLDVK